ncbi:MAG: UDP-N-acetylmuramate--L-alanine ligase [Flavobacteriaceae bacterium]|nr:UDP-N-acetylmuramate--L-alanine ligase [Flavobacteriaceae bacterium]
MSTQINIATYKNIFFLGIGGIGMSALARYFSLNGKNIAGYDKVVTQITEKLQKIKIPIHFNDEVSNIPIKFLDKKNTLIVYTPAISKNHKEYNYFKNNGFTILKRAVVLGLITKETFCFAVAGTHGKTTTSAILGHILKESGVNATSFLGGVATNYNTNLILGGDKISVVEADEYDRSFLQLSPNIACITATDADHLDSYGKVDALEKSFKDFTKIVSDKLVVRYGLPLRLRQGKAQVNGITFGLEEKADFQAKNIRVEKENSVFDVKTPLEIIENIKFQMFGDHNILNALAALTMANIYGVSLEKIKKALRSFRGIERRFNLKINTENLVLIDDYAHHPTEINAVFQTIKTQYPNKNKIVIFQPHLFTRTRDFAADFAKSLAQFDEILLLKIYPARELPIKGITSKWLAEKIRKINPNIKLITLNATKISSKIKKENTVIAMLGAGDIGVIINEVCENLQELNTLEN